MLRSLTLALAMRGHVVSVIAQHRNRLADLAREGNAVAAERGGRINPLPVDYGHDGELTREIGGAIAAHGPVSLAACWIHDDAPRALPLIASFLRGNTPPTRLFHVVGSATADPALKAFARAFADEYPSIAWRRVLLGFKVEPKGARWLTHEEIWRGVLNAIDHDWHESIIGVIRPWSARP